MRWLYLWTIFVLAISFIYFLAPTEPFCEEMLPIINNPKDYITHLQPPAHKIRDENLLQVRMVLRDTLQSKKTRNVSHYTQQFIDTLFKRHHFAAVIAVFIAFLFLMIIGFFLENKFFQIPAAASITIFFAILIGVSGAFTYFCKAGVFPILSH